MRPISGLRANGCIYTGLSTPAVRRSTSFSRLNAMQRRPNASSPKRWAERTIINTDKHSGYPPAIVQLKAEGALEENCRHRPVQYLNNVLEQDHRANKRRIRASQHFRSFWGAWRTIVGYEAIHMIREGQACWSAASAKVGRLHRFILGLFAATN
jgi:DDE domain